MDVLTRERAKPALPWGGTHQLIDFTLSNLAHSGITDVWISVDYLATSLDEHLQSGRPWDLDRNRGGYRRLVPETGPGEHDPEGAGNADDLYSWRDEITRHGADVVLVASADHVFAADLRPMIAAHVELGAECTILTSEVPVSEATHKAVVTTRGRARRCVEGSVTAERVATVAEKPQDPSHGRVAAEIFLYRADVLVAELTALHRERLEDGGQPIGDFAEHLMPRLVDRGRTWAIPLPGYWKDVGRPSAYLQSHRDLVRGRTHVFDDPDWPILTNSPRPMPSRVAEGAVLVDALLSPGCDIRGQVVRSVLGPGVRVATGAVVEDSVLFEGVVVEAGARVATAIVDSGVRIGAKALVGEVARGRLGDAAVTLVGRDSTIAAGARVPPRARLEPGTRA